MRLIFTSLLSLSFVILAACAPQTEAEKSGPWSLVPDESGMTYVTIKNGSLGEVNTFREISGSVSESGQAELVINLDSVDTNNETRDPRMKEHVFETNQYPTANVTANLEMAQFENMPIGGTETVLLDMTLDLHGVSEQFDFYVLVTRLGANKVRVDNKAPLILDGEDLAKMQELAGLESITPVVSATVALTFER